MKGKGMKEKERKEEKGRKEKKEWTGGRKRK